MDFELLESEAVLEVDPISIEVGNIPFLPNQSMVSVMRDRGRIVGFAGVQAASHAAGSWVAPEYRLRGYSYELRKVLENGMRKFGIKIYFSLPQNDFEKALFAKYGPVQEKLVQVREL